MNTKMTNMEMSDSLSTEIDKRVEHIEKILHERDRDGSILTMELGKETNHHKNGEIFFTRMNLVRGSDEFNVESEKEDVFQALYAASDELVAQIKSEQDRAKDIQRKRGKDFKDSMHTTEPE